MSSQEITARSSAADQARASEQLAQANQQLNQFISSLPSTATFADVTREGRRIANQFEFISYGAIQPQQVSGQPLRLEVGGDFFFINGVGLAITPDGSTFVGSTSPRVPLPETATPTPTPTAPPAATVPTEPPFNLPLDQFEDPAIRAVEERASQPPPPRPPSLDVSGTVFPRTDVERFDTISDNDPRVVVQTPSIETVRPPPRPPSLGSTTAVSTAPPGTGTGTFNQDPFGGLSAEIPGNSRTVNNNTFNNDDQGGPGTGLGTPDSPFELPELVIPIDPDRGDTPDGELDSTRPNVNGQGQVTVSPGTELPGSSDAELRDSTDGAVEKNNPAVALRPNVLHDYANWSYGINLYMLTPSSHQSIVRNGTVTQPETELDLLLIKSGGAGNRGKLGGGRDYYIENLRFLSVVGQNSRTARSSNNFDITFDIVEPYGVAFMSELVRLASENGIQDQFEVPYLLEVKFRGYDDLGRVIPEIPGSGPKYIPIKIVNLTFRITSSATIYTVTAVPFAHAPLQHLEEAFISESISIEGSTFEELMESLFEHMNNNEDSSADSQSREPDEYEFKIHDDDLRNSRVGFEHVTDGNVISIERQDMNGGLMERVQITGGSTLKSAINAIAAATDFGARFNTVGQPESDTGNENRPFRLLKIIPVVSELGLYNTSTKRYSKKITYRIDTEKHYGHVLPDMPGAPAQARGWQKEYNWLFTGKNKDIMDFQAEYNVQYFNIRNVFTQVKGNTLGTPSAEGNPIPNDGLSRTEAGASVYTPAIYTVTSPVTNAVYNSYRGSAHQLASDHMDNILNNPSADMMVVDLEIVGDPDWIPQDRSILPKQDESSGDSRIINGSLAVDVHDTLVMLKFRTPRDYDPQTGLMQIESDQTFVQGLYRAITVENNFADGKFTQKLKLIRLQKQIGNDSANIPQSFSPPATRPRPRPSNGVNVDIGGPPESDTEILSPSIDTRPIGEITGEFTEDMFNPQ